MTIFNAQQHDAIHITERDVIVVAGAGSGKTSVLVRRYLHLLQANPDWAVNSIVAITFTQKAAAEMRARVRAELSRLANDPGLERSARALWRAKLNVIDSARVGTIHALCADILRANAAEAMIDPDFVVLDEAQTALLIDDVLEAYLRASARDQDPALALFERGDSKSIRAALKQGMFSSTVLPDHDSDPMRTWDALWMADCERAITALRADVAFWEAASYPPARLLVEQAADDLQVRIWTVCLPLLDQVRNGTDMRAIMRACVEMIATIKLTGGKSAVWGDKAAVEAAKAQLKHIRNALEAVAALTGEPPDEPDRVAAADVALWHRLIAGAKRAYADAKRALSALDFDDLESAARDLLRQHAHVRARYHAEFRHVLVDEFQDTNATQWAIITALVQSGRPGGLFLVGDPKQSIYAFRGADVSVFESTRASLRTGGGHEIIMATSYRTHTMLVSAFNHLFDSVLQRDENSTARLYQVMYDRMDAARNDPPDARPPIELILYDRNNLPDDDGEGETARRWEASALAARIREIVEDEGWLVYDRSENVHRRIRYGDVAFLFQAMSHIGIYESALKDTQLPFVTVAGRGYYDRQEVWDVLNLLRALHTPSDDLSLAAALRSPMFALSDDALFALRSLLHADDQTPMRLFDALQWANEQPVYIPSADQRPVKDAWRIVSELRALAGRVTTADLLRAMLEKTGYLAILSGLPDGGRRRGNLEKLIDKAETSGRIGLGAFSAYLDELSANETREGETTLDAADAIQLMTVHKSKGLEFPLVVLVDCAYDKTATQQPAVIIDAQAGIVPKFVAHDAMTQDDETPQPYAYRRALTVNKARDDAEKRRLLYVAATRAQDYLLISGGYRVNDKGEWTLKGWMRWLSQPFTFADMPLTHGSVIRHSWGILRLNLPPFPREQSTRVTSDALADDSDSAVEPIMPPLLQAVRVQRDDAARSLSVTQIADLGGALFASPAERRSLYRQRWLRSVFYQAPDHIETVTDHTSRGLKRRLGQIVHSVLRVRQPDDDRGELRALIESLVWEYGVVDPTERDYLIEQAAGQLALMRHTDVLGWMRDARQCYRELSFVFQTEKRTIYGAMDVLIERADGSWAVIDFKTDHVGDHGVPYSVLQQKALRYALQVGIYAAAVNALIGVVPATFIHYITPRQTIEIQADVWQSQLARLEDYIGSLIQDDDA